MTKEEMEDDRMDKDDREEIERVVQQKEEIKEEHNGSQVRENKKEKGIQIAQEENEGQEVCVRQSE